MMKKMKGLKKPLAMSAAVGAGIGMGCVVCLTGVLVTALMINGEMIKPDASGYGVVLTLLLAAFTAAMVAMKGREEKLLLTAGISTMGMLALLLVGNLLLPTTDLGGLGVTALVMIAGMICAVMLRSKPKNRNKFRRRKF